MATESYMHVSGSRGHSSIFGMLEEIEIRAFVFLFLSGVYRLKSVPWFGLNGSDREIMSREAYLCLHSGFKGADWGV